MMSIDYAPAYRLTSPLLRWTNKRAGARLAFLDILDVEKNLNEHSFRYPSFVDLLGVHNDLDTDIEVETVGSRHAYESDGLSTNDAFNLFDFVADFQTIKVDQFWNFFREIRPTNLLIDVVANSLEVCAVERMTLAHEIGHLCLSHREFEKIKHSTIDTLLQFGREAFSLSAVVLLLRQQLSDGVFLLAVFCGVKNDAALDRRQETFFWVRHFSFRTGNSPPRVMDVVRASRANHINHSQMESSNDLLWEPVGARNGATTHSARCSTRRCENRSSAIRYSERSNFTRRGAFRRSRTYRQTARGKARSVLHPCAREMVDQLSMGSKRRS
jgi:hypothetical protein